MADCEKDYGVNGLMARAEEHSVGVAPVTDAYTYQSQTGSGRAGFYNKLTELRQQKNLNDTTGEALKVGEYASGDWAGNGKRAAHDIVALVRDPVDYLGETLIQQVDELHVDHYKTFRDNIADSDAQEEYREAIRDLFDDFEFTEEYANYSQLIKGEYEDYKRYYLEGGDFYHNDAIVKQAKTFVQGANNYLENLIRSSETVIVGNIFEGVIKLPALYTKESLPAFKAAMKKGLWKKHPEMEKQGLYGVTRPEEGGIMDKASTLIEYTDVPLKNIAYEAGLLRTGKESGGRKAIEDVMFVKRFGNTNRMRRSKGGRLATSLANYTMSSAFLGVNSMQKALKGDKQAQFAVGYMLSMSLALGGTQAVAEPIIDIVGLFDEELADDMREGTAYGGIPGVAALTQFRAPEFFILAKSVGFQFGRMGKSFTDGVQHLKEGRIGLGAYEIFGESAMLGVASFLPGSMMYYLGDATLQKGLRFLKRNIIEQASMADWYEDAAKEFKTIGAVKAITDGGKD